MDKYGRIGHVQLFPRGGEIFRARDARARAVIRAASIRVISTMHVKSLTRAY